MFRTTAVVTAVFAAVTLSGCGELPPEAEEQLDSLETFDPMAEFGGEPDFTGTKKFEIDGRSVNVSCSGAPVEGRPVVFLLHGGGDSVKKLADFQKTLGKDERVCSYDRLGAGASDKPGGPQTLESTGEVLTGVIDRVAGDSPVVLAGHSLGGVIAGRYAPDHQDRVAGLVLMDATSPTQQADLTEEIPESATGPAADLRDQTLAALAGEGPEQLEVPDGEVRSAGDIPVEVIQHGVQYLAEVPEYGPGLEEAWTEGQNNWLKLSGRSNLTTAEESGHHIYVDQPDLAAEKVRDVVSAAAEG
ncbi:alpha/beta hydrolase [Streptomonospora sediminis]